ncbi:MAG: LON peptidase substrate-binding domain-containing protein, partial [Gemmatimonadota bacterium]|nr:LON peptidase substrate-binding domain-containing protein [Gemmatimonadota bacterium]
MTEKAQLPQTPDTLPDRMPVLAVRSTVVFPMGATALQVGFAPNVEALAAHPQPETLVAIVSTQEEAQPLAVEALQKIAVGARVLDRLNLPGGTIQVTLQGLWRIRLREARFADGFYTARPERVEEEPADPAVATELIDRILNVLGGVAARVERVPDEAPRILRMNLTEPGRFGDLAATLSQLKISERDAVLQELRVEHRLRYVAARLDETWERVREIEHGEGGGGGAHPRTPEAIRKQIRTLQTELGNMDPAEHEADEMLRRIALAQLPPRVAAAARQEANRLRPGASAPSEAIEIRNHLATLLELPWTDGTPPPLDLAAVRAALDAEHVGLEETKRRLLEVLSVAALRGDLRGPVPCLTGPPGVGKRSLAAA